MNTENALDRFDTQWRSGKLPEIEHYIEGANDQECREVLPELIAIDLEYRWRISDQSTRNQISANIEQLVKATQRPDDLGSSPMLEAYFKRWPALKSDDATVATLVAEEYRARHRWGDRPGQDEYVKRFGDSPAIVDALNKMQQELDSDSSPGETQQNPSSTIELFERAHANQQPAMFGRYKLIKLVGEGGMGEVWLAEDTKLERAVALKIPRLIEEGQEFIDRFINEAKSAAILRHPGICPVYDAGEIDGKPFMTMAYIEGPTLDQFWDIARHKNSENVVDALIAEQFSGIADAINAAHDAGIVHRDIKPGNVIIDRDDHPIVTDFGLAHRKRSAAEVQITRTGDMFGSPAFMSPEQVEESREITAATDIYSLGVTLFRCLTGQLPFAGSVGLTMVKIIRDDPPLPSSMRPEVDRELEQLCLQMLAKKPQQRPRSMREISDQLSNIAKRLAAGRKLKSLATKNADRLRTRRWVLGSVTGLMIIALVAFAYTQLPKLWTAAGDSQQEHVEYEYVPGAWINMFRGDDLEGWTPVEYLDLPKVNSTSAYWTVDERATLRLNPVVRDARPGSSMPTIITNEEFKNYEFQFSYVAYHATRYRIYPRVYQSQVNNRELKQNVGFYVTIDQLGGDRISGSIIDAQRDAPLVTSAASPNFGGLHTMTVEVIEGKVTVRIRSARQEQVDGKDPIVAEYDFGDSAEFGWEPGKIAIAMNIQEMMVRMMRIRKLKKQRVEKEKKKDKT